MPNITTTNVDIGSVILEGGEFRDDEITFGGAGTLVEGTILARDSASGLLVPFVKGGVTDGNGVPKAILTYGVEAVGAGDEPARVAVSGKFRKERLVIDADGDASNVDAVVIDQLRDYSLVPVDVDELNILGNQ